MFMHTLSTRWLPSTTIFSSDLSQVTLHVPLILLREERAWHITTRYPPKIFFRVQKKETVKQLVVKSGRHPGPGENQQGNGFVSLPAPTARRLTPLIPAFKSLENGKLNRIYQKAMPGVGDGVLSMLAPGRRWKNQRER